MSDRPDRKVPKVSIEVLERGPDYPTPYRAHIIGDGFDHHGEAETPELALVYAATRWLEHERKWEVADDAQRESFSRHNISTGDPRLD